MKNFRPALILALLFFVITGLVFPLTLTGIAQILFPVQANGSMVKADGHVIGSLLIAQKWSGRAYFHPRPSANDYDANNSGGTNLGPTNPQLTEGAKGFEGVKELAESYRKENGLNRSALIPADAVTRSSSGLDPDISIENAEIQAKRIAKARSIPFDVVIRMISQRTQHRFLEVFGANCVNVLQLNLALDQKCPLGRNLPGTPSTKTPTN